MRVVHQVLEHCTGQHQHQLPARAAAERDQRPVIIPVVSEPELESERVSVGMCRSSR